MHFWVTFSKYHWTNSRGEVFKKNCFGISQEIPSGMSERVPGGIPKAAPEEKFQMNIRTSFCRNSGGGGALCLLLKYKILSKESAEECLKEIFGRFSETTPEELLKNFLNKPQKYQKKKTF